jgi:hypothetical protein
LRIESLHFVRTNARHLRRLQNGCAANTKVLTDCDYVGQTFSSVKAKCFKCDVQENSMNVEDSYNRCDDQADSQDGLEIFTTEKFSRRRKAGHRLAQVRASSCSQLDLECQGSPGHSSHQTFDEYSSRPQTLWTSTPAQSSRESPFSRWARRASTGYSGRERGSPQQAGAEESGRLYSLEAGSVNLTRLSSENLLGHTIEVSVCKRPALH